MPHELVAALKMIISSVDHVKNAATDDELLAACRKGLIDLSGVMPKSTDTAKNGAGLHKIFNSEHGLNGIMYPTLLERTGSYLPGTHLSLSSSRFL
jgi:hypothetical protein